MLQSPLRRQFFAPHTANNPRRHRLHLSQLQASQPRPLTTTLITPTHNTITHTIEHPSYQTVDMAESFLEETFRDDMSSYLRKKIKMLTNRKGVQVARGVGKEGLMESFNTIQSNANEREENRRAYNWQNNSQNYQQNQHNNNQNHQNHNQNNQKHNNHNNHQNHQDHSNNHNNQNHNNHHHSLHHQQPLQNPQYPFFQAQPLPQSPLHSMKLCKTLLKPSPLPSKPRQCVPQIYIKCFQNKIDRLLSQKRESESKHIQIQSKIQEKFRRNSNIRRKILPKSVIKPERRLEKEEWDIQWERDQVRSSHRYRKRLMDKCQRVGKKGSIGRIELLRRREE